MEVKTSRAFALDALRGYAILTMVLSGTIASTLPRWMYHAQVPPPDHKFDPSIFGITWVDLVFPFFLFAMGAAFPFSLGRKFEQGVSKLMLAGSSVLRGLQLAFFAIFIQHMYPWVVSEPQDYKAWLTTLAAFVLMFPMFMRLPGKVKGWVRAVVKLLAYLIAVAMLFSVSYAGGRTFSLGFSNIIILVLANMAIFGSVAYIFTFQKPLARLAILPFVMAILLTRLDGSSDGWQKLVMGYSPVPWLYSFYYLKYLFIVIPGSIAGEYLREWISSAGDSSVVGREDKKLAWTMLIVALLLVVANLYGLFTRQLILNLLVTIILLTWGWLRLTKAVGSNAAFWRKLFVAGAYMLLVGLFFESFEGGIRKDHSTFSYYFVTSGLAFMALIAFSVMCDVFRWSRATSFLVMAGQNPMIAYVGSSMVVMPILSITGLWNYVNMLSNNAWDGLLRGLIITSMVALLAMFFTRIKWFWRT